MYDFPTYISINCECPNCKQNVSDSALFCPNCGCVFKGNFFSLIEELKKNSIKTEINKSNDKNDDTDKNINQRMVLDNMVIGIKIPIKLDLDNALKEVRKVMKKITMDLESKENKINEEIMKKIYEDLINGIIKDIEKIKRNIKLEYKNRKGTKDKRYIIDYNDENEFHNKERAIKKYNMLAYKKLLFDYYPSFREGKFQGVLISSDEKEKIEKYELTLPTDKTFVKVHGNITLHYTVYLEEKVVVLVTITPENVLTKGDQKELTTYKGVMVSKSHKDLDMFKIDLLNSMNKNG